MEPPQEIPGTEERRDVIWYFTEFMMFIACSDQRKRVTLTNPEHWIVVYDTDTKEKIYLEASVIQIDATRREVIPYHAKDHTFKPELKNGVVSYSVHLEHVLAPKFPVINEGTWDLPIVNIEVYSNKGKLCTLEQCILMSYCKELPLATSTGEHCVYNDMNFSAATFCPLQKKEEPKKEPAPPVAL